MSNDDDNKTECRRECRSKRILCEEQTSDENCQSFRQNVDDIVIEFKNEAHRRHFLRTA